MKPKKFRKYPCVLQNFLNLASRGQLREAVDALPLLSRRGVLLNSKIIGSLLRQISDAKSIKEGKLVHLHLKQTGSKHPNTFLDNHLIDMYAKCGDHLKAREVFDKMRVRNLYSWNNMLSGYAKLGMAKAARKLFDKMPERDFVSWNTMVMAYVQGGLFDEAVRCYLELRRSDFGYNEYSFAGVLTVCVKLRALWLAKPLHCQVFVLGFLSNTVLTSSIVDSYAKCGDMGDARRLFDEMKWRDVLAWTTLLSGYAKDGDMKSAREIFHAMPEKNSVSWTAMISGYAHSGMEHHALELFKEMIKLNVEPDQFTYSSCLSACASMISSDHGMQLHSHLITAGIRPNVVVVSSLIGMYSKCGSFNFAKRVFDTTKNKQHVVLWNTMISALANHGCGKQAIKIFVDMVRLGVKPDGVTFLVLLNACSHSGLVQEGLSLFGSMKADYSIVPDQEHYACLIDLLGRSGCFDEMMNQLKKMPFKPDDCVWNALIGVCKIHGDVELSRIVARHLVEIDPRSPAAYLLLSAVYAALGRWESAKEVRDLMQARCVEKDTALSWLEVDRKLQLDIESNSSQRPGRNTTSVLELLADGSALYNVQRLDVYASKQDPVAEEDINFLRDTCRGKEKVVKLHYYIHHFGPTHPNATTYEVARACITYTSPTLFGSVRAIDELVTADPDPSSQQLGRCQGLVIRSDLSVPAIALNVNIYFTSGKYAGSTLSFLGRYEIDNDKPETVAAGGTGSFRFAHGYSIQTSVYSTGRDSAILGFETYITYNDKCSPSKYV